MVLPKLLSNPSMNNQKGIRTPLRSEFTKVDRGSVTPRMRMHGISLSLYLTNYPSIDSLNRKVLEEPCTFSLPTSSLTSRESPTERQFYVAEILKSTIFEQMSKLDPQNRFWTENRTFLINEFFCNKNMHEQHSLVFFKNLLACFKEDNALFFGYIHNSY